MSGCYRPSFDAFALRDLLSSRPCRPSHGREAEHDDSAAVDGEREEDASVLPAGGHVFAIQEGIALANELHFAGHVPTESGRAQLTRLCPCGVRREPVLNCVLDYLTTEYCDVGPADRLSKLDPAILPGAAVNGLNPHEPAETFAPVSHFGGM